MVESGPAATGIKSLTKRSPFDSQKATMLVRTLVRTAADTHERGRTAISSDPLPRSCPRARPICSPSGPRRIALSRSLGPSAPRTQRARDGLVIPATPNPRIEDEPDSHRLPHGDGYGVLFPRPPRQVPLLLPSKIISSDLLADTACSVGCFVLEPGLAAVGHLASRRSHSLPFAPPGLALPCRNVH